MSQSWAMDQVRTIDAGVLPTRFARRPALPGTGAGPVTAATQWRYCMKLVVFDDSGGEAACPRRGTAGPWAVTWPGHGEGDAIAGPFHDWRWGGDGRARAAPTRGASRPQRGPVLAHLGSGRLFRLARRRGVPAARGRDHPADRRRDSKIGRLDLGLDPGRGGDSRGGRQRGGHGDLLLRRFAFHVFKNVSRATSVAVPRTRSRADVGTGPSNMGRAGTTLRRKAFNFGPFLHDRRPVARLHGMTMASVLMNCHYRRDDLDPAAVTRPSYAAAPACPNGQASGWPPSSPNFVGLASSRTWRSGGPRAGSTTRALREDGRSTRCAARTSSSTRRGRHRAGHGGTGVRVRDRHHRAVAGGGDQGRQSGPGRGELGLSPGQQARAGYGRARRPAAADERHARSDRCEVRALRRGRAGREVEPPSTPR